MDIYSKKDEYENISLWTFIKKKTNMKIYLQGHLPALRHHRILSVFGSDKRTFNHCIIWQLCHQLSLHSSHPNQIPSASAQKQVQNSDPKKCFYYNSPRKLFFFFFQCSINLLFFVSQTDFQSCHDGAKEGHITYEEHDGVSQLHSGPVPGGEIQKTSYLEVVKS